MVVKVQNIKNLLGIKNDTEDLMIQEHLNDSIAKFSNFSDMVIKYYGCYLVSHTIKSASRVQKDDDVTYFKYDFQHWFSLFEESYNEELAESDDESDYGTVCLANVRVD